MSARINFEDNIFLLNTRIRLVRNLLLLEADPDLFLERTMEDLAFVDRALDTLFGKLSGNSRYIEREEQLRNLSETESSLMEVIAGMRDGNGSISARQFPATKERLGQLFTKSGERKKEIDSLSRSAGDSPATEPLVSSDELSELLKDME